MDKSQTLRDQLVVASTAYAAATGIKLSTLSTRLLNGGMQLKRIADGGDLNTRKFEEAMSWLSDNWPDGVEWPAGVERPARAGVAA